MAACSRSTPKFNFDDNALYRQPDIVAMRDKSEEDAARNRGIQIFRSITSSLDGSIACLVNGAGLAMATMDIVQHTLAPCPRTSSMSAAARRKDQVDGGVQASF